MNIYLLSVRKGLHPHIMYDAYDAHVVAARSPHRARRMVPYGDEGDIWTDANKTTCTTIGVTITKKEEVILSSFNAG
jgi:hypothetical protein